MAGYTQPKEEPRRVPTRQQQHRAGRDCQDSRDQVEAAQHQWRYVSAARSRT
jgi:hypothetical protein